MENGARYENFRDWIDDQIAPTFNKVGKDRPPAEIWLQDVIRIAERTLPYAMLHPMKDAKGDLITPEYLIEHVGFGKLKMTSSHFVDNTETPSRNALLVDLTRSTAAQLRKTYTTPRIPAIHAAINITPKGMSDIMLMGLSANQVGLLRSALGEHNLIEHQVHFNEANRYALLTLLPVDAQKQTEEDVVQPREDEVA